MNETSRNWQSELERATSRQLPGDVELSKETAELREGWLALGQLLDASERGFDPRKLLEKLERSPGEDVHVATLAPTTTRPVGLWRPWVTTVVAASILGALALAGWEIWKLTSREFLNVPIARQLDSDRDAVKGHGATATDEPIGVAQPNDLVAQDSTSAADEASETAWEDSFDERLAATQERIWQVRVSSTASEVRIETLRQAVEQIDSELTSSSL